MATGKKTGGRQKGTPNKASAEFRETVTKLLAANGEQIQTWLTTVANGDAKRGLLPDPGKAIDLLAKLAEYAAPKLARTELSGPNGGPMQNEVKTIVINGR